MGGNAFPTLPCPRLSHNLYQTHLTKTTTVLSKYYEKIICHPEAPSKPDHGDIDILASIPTHTFSITDLSTALGAIQHTRVGVTTSFAIPLIDTDYAGNAVAGEAKYVQVDIHVCAPEDVEWEMFHSSYGDLMQILGALNRSIGLTANNHGLHLRIQEIEIYNKKKSMIYLSKDPRVVMEFLGLNNEKYFTASFKTNEDVFDWCAQAIYTHLLPYLEKVKEETKQQMTANATKKDPCSQPA